jgi:hypothetical protein
VLTRSLNSCRFSSLLDTAVVTTQTIIFLKLSIFFKESISGVYFFS